MESNHVKSWRQEPVGFSGYVSGCHTNGLKVQPGLSPKMSLQETQASLVDGENWEDHILGSGWYILLIFIIISSKVRQDRACGLTKSGERLSSGVVL